VSAREAETLAIPGFDEPFSLELPPAIAEQQALLERLEAFLKRSVS